MALISTPFLAETYDDEATGRKVTRVFPVGQTGSHAYFTSTSYDAEARLILSAEFEGRMQLCRVDLERREQVVLTDFDEMRPAVYCVSPTANCAMVIVADTLARVDLETGESEIVFRVPDGFRISLPTVDAAGSRVAFAISEKIPRLTASERIYSTMQENFFFRPRSMVCTIDLADNRLSVIYGEMEWISHVLINPVDPDTVVFCHEGGSFAQHRLWVVDARPLRKKTATRLYDEELEDFFVHEYFLRDGTLAVQHSRVAGDNPRMRTADYPYNAVLFLDMAGGVVAEYVLPGSRSGHVQSNSDNSVLVADGYFPDHEIAPEEGRSHLALNIPEGDRLRVERLCFTGTSWRTQLSHPHPIFSPDDRRVVFSSDHGGTNSAFVVEV